MTKRLRFLSIVLLTMLCMGVYAQTTTVTYSASEKIDRFEELPYFVGATAVKTHEFVKEGDATVGNGTVVYEGTVTEFGNYCLQWQTGLTSIVVPDGVKKLGFQAFKACQNLTDISLPTSLEEIGDVSGLAFEGCSNLEKGHFVVKDLKWWCGLVIKGVASNPVYYAKHIYDAQGQEITDLVIPDDVTSVGDYTFPRCEGLKSVTFHDNVTYIGRSAFTSCTGLTTVALPKNMKKLEEYAFSRCSNLATVTIPEGMENVGYCAFDYCGLKSLTLPSTINKMHQSFHHCEQLETLTLRDGLSDISGSFYSCNALKEVRIPGSLKTMIYQDFSGCASLETVIIDEGVEEVAGFQDCPKLVNLTIPSSVKTLGGLGFRNCTSLQIVNLPEGVEYVSTFNGCTSLKQINFPSTITYVGTFKDCTALEKVIVDDMKAWCQARHYDAEWYGPQKLAGKLSMRNGKGEIEEITDLVIPEGTASIEAGAFCHLPTIASVTIPATVTYMHSGAFANTPAIADVWCYASLNDLNWSNYKDNSCFMPDKATRFHVENAAAWLEKYPEANVTFVDLPTAIKASYKDTVGGQGSFNLTGQPVGEGYKGIIVRNGQKMVNK